MAINDNTVKINALIERISALPEQNPAPVLQQKSVVPTQSAQAVTPDTGFDGLSSVMVNPIPSSYIIPSGQKAITANGTHDVAEYASVSVNVPIPDALPEGVKAIDSGTFTPASDATTKYTFNHGLGRKPNFVAFWRIGDISYPGSGVYAGTQIAKWAPGTSATSGYSIHGNVLGYTNTDGSNSSGTRRSGDTADMGVSSVALNIHSSFTLKAGYTYRWIVAVVDGLDE